jgi:Domain of unknown function (DUF4381)
MTGGFRSARAAVAAGALLIFLAAGSCAVASAQPPPGPPAEDIRDIRGPKLILSEWVWPGLLAAGVLLVGGSYLLWRRRRRLKSRALLPHELALQRLEATRALMQPANAREFTTAVSGIIRGYIEQRFSVTATRRTTEEFLRDLLESTHTSLARYQNLLRDFLNRCDLVKFAAISVTLQDLESLYQNARAFVLDTAKPEEVVAAPESGESSGNEVRA